jgi:hypothetical protein
MEVWMIKDIVVNLPLQESKDRTTAFAASLASYFDAHLTGIAFVLWPVIARAKFGPAEAKFIKDCQAGSGRGPEQARI